MNELIAWPMDEKEYTAAGLGAAYSARSRGILRGTDFTASANGDLTITIGVGLGCLHVNDFWAIFPVCSSEQTITFEDSDGSFDRIDMIALQLDKNANRAGIEVVTGMAADTPEYPAVRRNDDYDEIFLYAVYRTAGSIEITAADITDLRLSGDYCGLMESELDSVDTSVMEAQITAFIAENETEFAVWRQTQEQGFETWKRDQKTNFIAWTEGIKDILDKSAAGHLQNQIDALANPDFDDTGEVEGIGSFPDFMAKFVKKTSIYQLLADFKAGLKFALHKGHLVNNGLCETPGEFALDAAYGHTMAEQITGLYSDLGGFKPLIDETGKITGYKTTVGGADTVFPFSEIDKSELIMALSNSGLGLTLQSTPAQIYAALSERFPGDREFITSISTSYQGLNDPDFLASDTKAQLNGSAVTAILSSYGGSLNRGYRQIVNTNSVDLDNYDKLILEGNVSTLQGNAYAPTSAVYLCNSSGTVVYTFRSGTGVGAINVTLDITNYKGMHFIKIVQEEYGCKITTTINRAHLS